MKNAFRILGIALLVFTMSFTSPSNKKLIVIDAGHGGHDMGSTFGFHTEKEIVSKISQKIKGLNTNSDIEIVLIRDNDEFKSLADRVEKINSLNADLVLSLHVNSTKNETSSGIEAFVSDENAKYEDSKAHAEELVALLSNEKLQSRGVKTAPFMVLKKTNTAAVTLELGFLSNPSDRNYITSQAGQNEIASKIAAYLTK
jgi:N-acetylmuramoyl-L-alanine amidase